ncbi:hypothetical protein [Hansschlegelia sp.]|uniref:hypothetical protein n=1 Tax=Hansschlegelia sp. TaxID=2041892 RepID=UPI002BD598CB|nr:hypothetical protein [Hansschlegelia sp.]HVI29750.1 hypothetical protein [Hansschlegelia sp.]
MKIISLLAISAVALALGACEHDRARGYGYHDRTFVEGDRGHWGQGRYRHGDGRYERSRYDGRRHDRDRDRRHDGRERRGDDRGGREHGRIDGRY